MAIRRIGGAGSASNPLALLMRALEADDASTDDAQDPMRGLMQALAPLLQAMAPMFRSVDTPGDAIAVAPVSKPKAKAKDQPVAPDTGSFHAADPSIERWAPDIERAAKLTGLDPNLIGAQMWRESHGDPSTNTQNIDGTRDVGLMQVGQERWSNVLAPALKPEDRAKIEQATGKKPEDLNVHDPHENVLIGAFHLKINIDKLGGNVHDALMMYVGPNDPAYADSILNKNIPALEAGQHMPDPL